MKKITKKVLGFVFIMGLTGLTFCAVLQMTGITKNKSTYKMNLSKILFTYRVI